MKKNWQVAGGKDVRRIEGLLQKLDVLIGDDSLLADLEKLLSHVKEVPTPTRNCIKGMNIEQDRLLRLKEVLEIVPVSKSTWWAWVANGKAPPAVRLGRCTCWKYSQIADFIAK